MDRIKRDKQKKRNSRNLNVDPLTGKPLQKLEKEAMQVDSKNRPATAGVQQQKRNSRFLSEAPKLSVMERNKMKLNFNMALASKKQEEEKTGQTTKEMERKLIEDS